MKSSTLQILVLVIVSFAFVGLTWSDQITEDGKKAFVANKCNMCHSLESAKIEKTTGGYQKSKDKNVPPDLSGIGSNRTAVWMKLFLLKKEKNNDQPHVRTFKGTDAELETITKWLETLK